MSYVSPTKVARIRANLDAIAQRLPAAQRHQRDIAALNDGYPANAPMNGSDGIGRASGPKTSVVERAALGAGSDASARLARYAADSDIMLAVSARLLADVDAGLPPVEPPATCNGGVGREGADVWASDAPCAKIATRHGLCDMHRMRERRYRADHGLEAREEL